MIFTGEATKLLENVENLIENGDFEEGHDVSWIITTGDGATASYAQAGSSDTHNGSISEQVDVTALPDPTNISTVRLKTIEFPVPEGLSEMYFSFYAKSLSGTSGVALVPFYYDSEGTKIDGDFGTSVMTTFNYYSKFLHSTQVPANAATFLIELRIGNDLDSYFFDDVLVTAPPLPSPSPGDLIINEVNSHANENASWIEILNVSGIDLSLDGVEVEHYRDNGNEPNGSIFITGPIPADGFVTVTKSLNDFQAEYIDSGTEADFEFTELDLNAGSDGVRLVLAGSTIIDRFNAVPAPGSGMTDNLLYLRKENGNDGSDLENHWCQIIELKKGTPGAPNEVKWLSGTNNEWHNPTNWDDAYQPCECNDVRIPSGGTQPVITTMDACARNVVVESGAELIINGKLTISKSAAE